MVSFGSATVSGSTSYLDFRTRTDGIVYQNSKVRIAEITDGASKTAIASEAVRSIGTDSDFPAGSKPPFPYQYTFHGSTDFNSTTVALNSPPSPLTTAAFDSLVNDWASKTAAGYNWRGAASTAMRGRGLSWAATTAGNSLTNGFLTPNSPIPDYVVHWSGFFGPKSHHRGGANVLFGDGRVVFLGEEINATLHRGLHSINGGEVVSND
jgi:prepilin-type processing-associated H-X9-DG protein